MKAKVQTRIDIDALRDIAGDRALARSHVYHREGMAEILWILQKRIVAQGDGNQAFEFFGDCDDLQYPGFLTVFLTVLTVCLENFFYDINVVFDQLMIEWE